MEILDGGVSSVVILVKTSLGAWVVKQALQRLRVMDPWFADRARIFAEVACLRLLHDKISGRPAPAVMLEDREMFACMIEYAGDGSRSWKQELLSGVVDRAVTHRVAEILAEIHSKTMGDEGAKKEFWDESNFFQLRLDPYLTTTALRHPDIKPHLDEVATSLTNRRLCLVHGDFSPKNILLLPGGRLWVIDCEVAHYGNPVFDIAFCTNHLILKSIHLNSLSHLEEAKSLWSTYWSRVVWADLEEDAVRTLAALMLARVDGKSPVEYLKEMEKEEVRNLSHYLVEEREGRFDNLIEAVRKQLEAGGNR